MNSSALDFLIEKSTEFGLVVSHQDGSQVHLEVPVLLADQTQPVYHLIFEAKGNNRLSVRELVPERLPSFCPERHINEDGTFCLGWEDVDDLSVTDADSAENFIAKLLKYLRQQERAARLRRWPDHRAWAHGSAAKHQQVAIEAAAAISSKLGEDARRGRLRFKRKGSGVLGSAIQVYSGDTWLFSVWERHKRPMNLRRSCICSVTGAKARILKKCSDHREQSVRLALALREQSRAEEKFWRSYKGRSCCGSINNCPLAEKD